MRQVSFYTNLAYGRMSFGVECIQEEEELGNEGIAMLCRGIGDFFVRKWELRELCLELCGMGESSAKCLANVLHRCVHLCVLSDSLSEKK